MASSRCSDVIKTLTSKAEDWTFKIKAKDLAKADFFFKAKVKSFCSGQVKAKFSDKQPQQITHNLCLSLF